ncbi:MAG: U32 family peptidase [Candidatus Omnitrophica bacterium]|nr:U32 family peptidase [Candidatus Omnitrophota bacterium]
MKLSVPTNWRNDFLPGLNKKNIAVIYGALNRDFVGSGRPSSILTKISKREAALKIAEIRRYGIKFEYLLNAQCLSNREWTRRGQREIRRLLDWLVGVKVDGVTVSMPYLLQMIKKCYPRLEVNISVAAGISSLAKARYWEDMGADQLTLLSTEANRDFELLRNLRRALNCRLQLIANLPCLHECPFYAYHISSVSHASQTGDVNKGFVIDYYPLLCKYNKLSSPWRMLAASWIRPEDLHYYKEAGIDRIKLIDRGWKSEYIQRAVEAYTDERYPGNLLDLFSDTTKYQAFSERYSWRRLKYVFHPMKYNLFLFRRRLKPLIFNDPSFLDNSKLEGFIKFFIDGKCRSGNCDKCDYCRDFAARAFSVPEAYRQEMLSACQKLLNDIIGGALFYYKSKQGFSSR